MNKLKFPTYDFIQSLDNYNAEHSQNTNMPSRTQVPKLIYAIGDSFTSNDSPIINNKHVLKNVLRDNNPETKVKTELTTNLTLLNDNF